MSRLAIPATYHHTLPAGFYCVSHGRASSTTDLTDPTNRAYVHALKPDSWRLIANISQMGTAGSPTTYDGGGLDFFVKTLAELNSGQVPKPRFLIGFNGGPYGGARPGSGSATDATNFVSSNTVEGSTGTCADWLASWLAKGYDIMGTEFWNEPNNTSVVDLAGRSWFTVASGNGTKATAWANVMARKYRAALAAVAGSSGVLLLHNANGNSAGRNGTSPYQEIVLGKGFISGWPWADDNIVGQGYTAVSLHAYSEGNGYQDQVNSMLYPTPTWGVPKHGYLATFDYVRATLLNGNGATAIPLGQSEWEPIHSWGQTGQGVSGDAVLSIISANRQQQWNMPFNAMMDAMRDEATPKNSAADGDQMLYAPSASTGGKWIRGARYFGQLQIVGQFLRNYRHIGRVPMYAGDTGEATWTVVPGFGPAGSNANAVQRHQAVYGFDAAGNLGVKVADVGAGGNEEITLDLPFDPVTAKVTKCPANYATFNAGAPPTMTALADTPFVTTTFGVTSRTLVTGANGVPSLGSGDTMLFEFTTNAPPPTVTGLATYDSITVANVLEPGRPQGYTRNRVVHGSQSTDKYNAAFPYGQSGVGTRLMKVSGAGARDERVFLVTVNVPTDAEYGNGLGTGFNPGDPDTGAILRFENVVGDLGTSDVANGVADTASKLPCAEIRYISNHKIETTLTAPYTGAGTLQVVSSAGFDATGSQGVCHIGDATKREKITFSGTAAGQLTGGSAPTQTWPAGTKVTYWKGGLWFVLNHFNGEGKPAAWPLNTDPVPGQRLDLGIRIIFGRNDGSTVRQGFVELYEGSSTTKTVAVSGANILNRAASWYRSPGSPYTQQYVFMTELGPDVITFPAPSGAAAGPWKVQMAATRVGDAVSEAVADTPVLNVTQFLLTHGQTANGTDIGTFSNHIAGLTDFGPGRINANYASGQIQGYDPAKITAQGFQLSPALGGSTPTSPPTNTTPPSVSGVPTQGATLTANPGTWTGTGVQFGYQWQVSYSGQPSSWINVAGGTAQTLTLDRTQVGLLTRVIVTATNASGSQQQPSAATSVIPTATGQWIGNGDFAVDIGLWEAFNGQLIGAAPLAGGTPPVLSRDTVNKPSGATASLKFITPGTLQFEGVRVPAGLAAFQPAGKSRVLNLSFNLLTGKTAVVSVTTFDAATGEVIRTSTPGAPVAGTAAGPNDWQPVQVTVPQPSADSYNTISVTTGATVQAYTARVALVSYADFVPAVTTPTIVQTTLNTNVCKATTARSQVYACNVTVPTGVTNGALCFFLGYDDRNRGAQTVKLDNATVLTRAPYLLNTINGPGVEMWYLLNPPSGAHTVNVVHANGAVMYADGYMVVQGVQPSGPVRANTTPAASSAGSTHATVTIPSSQNELVVGVVAQGQNGSVDFTPDAGQTDRWEDNGYTAALGGIRVAATTKPGAPTVTIGWSTTVSSQPWQAAAWSLVGVPAGVAPANTTPPAVTGTPTQGMQLVTDDGLWSGSPTSISYEWQRCDGSGANCVAIPGGSSRRYTLQPADVGHKIRVVVTAANQSGSAQQASAATAVVAGLPPVLTAAPVVTGPTTLGSTLHSSTGVFDNIGAQYAPVTYAYQWQTDDGAYGAFSNVGGATAADYVLVTADDNHRFRCVVTATNSFGAGDPAVSNIVGPAGPAGVIDDFNRPNESPNSQGGQWAPTPFQSGAYLNQVLDNMAAREEGALGSGQSWRSSVFDANLYCEISVPVLPVAGGVGIWTRLQNPGDPALAAGYGFDYLISSGGFQFYRLTGGSSFTPLGALNMSHTLADGEGVRQEIVGTTLDGYYIDVAGVMHHLTTIAGENVITGPGYVGFEISDDIMRVDNFYGGEFNVAVPTNTVAPAVTGTAVAGHVLTADTGTWDGSPSLFAYQWQRDAHGNSVYADIPGATNEAYLIVDADLAAHLRVRVVATNRAGASAPAASAPTVIVVPDPPINEVPPTIAGQSIVRSTLTSTPGLWAGDPLPTLLYQWQRSDDGVSGWTPIAAATADTYTLAGADFDRFVRLQVTGDNGAQTAATSNVLGPIRRTLIVSSQGGPLPYLDVSGAEVSNAARTVEYLRAGLGDTHGAWELGPGDVCGILYRTPGSTHNGGQVGSCDEPAVFASPAADPAPWYDPSEPGSSSFLGVIITDVKGYDGVTTRTTTARTAGLQGASFGGKRRTARTWKFTGVLVSNDDAGAEFGLRWLNSVLQGRTCATCDTGDLTVRLACPPADCTDDERGEWVSYEVALTAGPNETNPWAPGTQPDNALAGCRDYVEVDWTMTAGNPFLYKPQTAPSPPEVVGSFETCGSVCDYLHGPPGPLHTLNVSPPERGVLGAIYSFSSPSGMGSILLEAYDDCTTPEAVPVLQMQIGSVPVGGAVVVDCSRRAITVYTPDPNTGELVAADGRYLIELPDNTKAIEWIEARDCDRITCFAARKAHPCSQGGDTTVTIATQRREG